MGHTRGTKASARYQVDRTRAQRDSRTDSAAEGCPSMAPSRGPKAVFQAEVLGRVIRPKASSSSTRPRKDSRTESASDGCPSMARFLPRHPPVRSDSRSKSSATPPRLERRPSSGAQDLFRLQRRTSSRPRQGLTARLRPSAPTPTLSASEGRGWTCRRPLVIRRRG